VLWWPSCEGFVPVWFPNWPICMLAFRKRRSQRWTNPGKGRERYLRWNVHTNVEFGYWRAVIALSIYSCKGVLLLQKEVLHLVWCIKGILYMRLNHANGLTKGLIDQRVCLCMSILSFPFGSFPVFYGW
jgi:hypothetical protein